MKNEPLWLQGIKEKSCDKLTKREKADVLIIGGGLAGISTAFELRNKGKRIVLIEKDKVGHGVSARTTGKLTFLQELVYQKIESNFGEKTADLYLQSQKEAIDIVRGNVIDYHIDCNLEGVSSITFTNDFKELKNFFKEEKILLRNHIPYQIKTKTPFGKVIHAIEVKDTAVFHPVKYILALKEICLKEGVSIYENTRALDLEKLDSGYLVHTEESYIEADKVIICTHYPYFTIPGFIPLRTSVERSYLAAGRVDRIKKVSAISSYLPTQSFRYHQDKDAYLLYVGQSHKLGTKLNYDENFQKLLTEAKKYLKTVDYVWQNHDVMTNDGLPLIGKIERENDHLYLATGFNTWGMTNGVIAGRVLSDLVLGVKNRYEELFSPLRGMSVDSIQNFTINAFHSGVTYTLSHLKNYYSFYLDEVKISNLNGKKVGIYIDESGKYHIVSHTCPHMKCGLTFNMFEKTWDCPCHGSRFSIDGELLQGPSVHSIRI